MCSYCIVLRIVTEEITEELQQKTIDEHIVYMYIPGTWYGIRLLLLSSGITKNREGEWGGDIRT